MKRILIATGIVVVIGVGGYFLYDVAYSWGETAGYDGGYSVGYSAGHEAGYGAGEEDGYDTGYIVGEEDGYGAGYSTGEQDGYDEGYSLGEEDGYDTGYVLGEATGYTSGRQDGYDVGYSAGVEVGLGHGYTLKDPTYQEAVAFISQDRTNENEYVEDTYGVYVCSHFARDVCNNAEAEGFRCAFVEIRYLDRGHAIIAFNTIDRGIIYFEPQFDDEVEVALGESYSEINNYQKASPYDDTIRDFLVIW